MDRKVILLSGGAGRKAASAPCPHGSAAPLHQKPANFGCCKVCSGGVPVGTCPGRASARTPHPHAAWEHPCPAASTRAPWMLTASSGLGFLGEISSRLSPGFGRGCLRGTGCLGPLVPCGMGACWPGFLLPWVLGEEEPAPRSSPSPGSYFPWVHRLESHSLLQSLQQLIRNGGGGREIHLEKQVVGKAPGTPQQQGLPGRGTRAWMKPWCWGWWHPSPLGSARRVVTVLGAATSRTSPFPALLQTP